MEKFIMALDQGTTSSRALIFDQKGNIRSMAQKEFQQIFPKPGWVEHDPNEIWSSQVAVAAEAMSKIGINGQNLHGIGITNQRETTIVWDRSTGEPIYNAIVWQDRRTSSLCDELRAKGFTDTIRQKTGLVIDAYFSGTKVKWILDNVPGAREKANRGELAFGTVDTWLVWKLTRGRTHVTDVSNASRTMLFNINTLTWDKELLDLLQIPESILPRVASSSEVYDHTNTTFFATKVPIAGMAGDQQAALFGQMCTSQGMVKNTYGTGCFILMNTGKKPFLSKNNLVTTIAWQVNGDTYYALEGSIFIGGAVVQWLRDGLGIIKSSAEVEELARQVPDNGDLYLVPSFTGMGAPHWDQYARGLMIGISRGTTRAHIARAALESIAFQTMDVLDVMAKDTGINLTELRVDGGASANNLLMQFQSDVLGINVVRPKTIETTAMGAAYLAGLATGYWKNIEEIANLWQLDKTFTPGMPAETLQKMKDKWADAVERAKSWHR
ncbi:glycerol kinase GlpK [Tenuifilum sp.]|uniref:glycerol kinase GlpK n=1 Tax=Tenuifilum sp. TaxID=2760880 RepID=UPI001B454494|nr:glycerol kinase GlpK [Bacteroidales bacterium]HOK60705.1 glycerol kinase GlpK [Tenuifilum sp.]MBP9029724.1 glycerol kinase GlpK [Bacteroidales bacterium]HOK85340.1 glycerol kinase GlpK [Tenuifilum sp.]HPP89670.1 glycerol kinase GlpK [Tenuifilum sp.]